MRGCVAAVKADGHRLDAILCNAGIMMLPKLEKAHGYPWRAGTSDSNVDKPHPAADHAALATWLWAASEAIVQAL